MTFVPTAPNTPRVRLLAVQVQIQMVLDTGDELLPVNYPPLNIPASEWSNFAESGIQSALQEAQTQAAQQYTVAQTSQDQNGRD